MAVRTAVESNMNSDSAGEHALPPGPSIALFQTLQVLRNPYGYYAKMAAKYGRIFTVPALNGVVVLGTTPQAAKDIFTAEADTFDVFAVGAIKPILGDYSLIAVSGETHRKQRKLVMPPFHGARMRAYGEAMREVALQRTEGWREGMSIRVHETTRDISLDVILRTVFGVEGAEVKSMGALMTRVMDEFNPVLIFSTALQKSWFPPYRRYLAARAEYGDMLRVLIRRCRDDQAREGAPMRTDILSMFVAARHDDDSPMSDEEIRDQLQTLLVAGHETTAISLAWSLYWLHAHPAKLAKLRAELDALGPDASPDELAKLPYLDAVCLETLRLHPIVPDVIRKLNKPLVMDGHLIPAGLNVGIVTSVIHQDPVLYPNPTSFEPERWLTKRPTPFEYMPFGGGHRRCIGSAYSDYEMRIVLATLVARFDLALDGEDAPVRRNIVMGPKHGVRMKVLGRRESSLAA